MNVKNMMFALFVFIGLNTWAVDSEYCNTLVDPAATAGGGALDDASDSFYLNWTTEADGNMTVTIVTVPGSATTTFRNNGMRDAFTVNGEKVSMGIAINEDKTVITLTPSTTLTAGDKIVYQEIVEYKVGNDAPLNNLYPSFTFEYTYGATCVAAEPEPFATPVITGTADGKITFTHDDAATKHVLYVYREQSELLELKQEGIQSGDAMAVDRPGTYTLRVQSLTDQLEYLDSELSEPYSYKVEGMPEPWEATASEYCTYPMADGDGLAYMSWNTNEEGQVLIRISGADDDPVTAFRGTGMDVADFTVNGQAGTWFEHAIDESATVITLTPIAPLIPGDKIGYNAIVEYKTSLNADLWPTLQFEYTYGSNCASAPMVEVSATNLHFTPSDGNQVFFLSGKNLTGAVSIKAPKGITVSPVSIEPVDGVIEETPVSVLWDGGSSAGGSIVITGGGLVWPTEIALTSEGFSEYCNRVITQGNQGTSNHAYLTVEVAEDLMSMSFLIAPYVEGQTVSWNGNSIPVEKVTVNGQAPATVPVRTTEDNGTRIRITFAEALQEGDVVEFGAPLVWTIKEGETTLNGNCFIDPIMQYTVGLGCTLEETTLAVTSVGEPTEITHDGAVVTIEVAAGESPVKSIRLHEDNDKVEDLLLNKEADNVYTLAGLAEDTEYSFTVTAIDLAGNESAAAAQKLAFKTLKTIVASVLSVGEPFNMTDNSVQVRVEITEGDYPAASIRFAEDNELVADKVLPVSEDDVYTIDGLTVNTDYSFSVSVIDTEGNESEAFVTKLIFSLYQVGTGMYLSPADALLVYPVPTADVLHVQGMTLDFIQIVDYQGRVVLHATETSTLDVSGLTDGLYLLRAHATDGTTAVRKIAIEK